MINFFRYVAFAMTLLLLGASASEVTAQKAKKTSRRGPDGVKKGQVAAGNMDRSMLLDQQKAVASAKTSGGMTSKPNAALPGIKYDTGKGRFAVTDYKSKAKTRKAKQRKSKRLIDQDNPNGKMYQQSLNKRNRKFLLF
ncbi:hypothetical protein [Rufibacter sp. XAAS-G3-1]|uniref:hypothetical protein n=1 Tax=Rufibacter sp. XAAS-G3-1 TaxID=2729134 RepID=UPI0015E651F5|nr:hypothetical protein [Rufibacter sp. XAAS-G3-1]